MDREERVAIEHEAEIFGYLKQSHISKKNIVRLRVLSESSDEHIAMMATLVIEVAKVKPYKRKRLKVLASERADLLVQLEETGLIYAHHW
jgi:hypothetical protein